MKTYAKKIKKIIVSIVSIVLLMSFVVLVIVACVSNAKMLNYTVPIRYDGYFQYIIVGENSRYQDENNMSLAIVGFTESGLEQEALEIPREIEGKIVEHIGLWDDGAFRFDGGDKNHYVYCSDNLKKIYVHENLKKMTFFYGSEVDIMNCSNSLNIVFDGALYKKIYIYKSLFDAAEYSSNVLPANITFMNNYSDEVNGGYYRQDNIEDGEKISYPPIPVRDDHDFIGWYTEPECLNIWDFKVSPKIEENMEFRLYAGWQAL